MTSDDDLQRVEGAILLSQKCTFSTRAIAHCSVVVTKLKRLIMDKSVAPLFT